MTTCFKNQSIVFSLISIQYYYHSNWHWDQMQNCDILYIKVSSCLSLIEIDCIMHIYAEQVLFMNICCDSCVSANAVIIYGLLDIFCYIKYIIPWNHQQCLLPNKEYLSTCNFIKQIRDQSGYWFSQWEMTLHCNVISHWLSPYPECSLQTLIMWYRT